MPELFPKPRDCASVAHQSPGESPGGFLDFLADSLVRAIADNGEGVLVYVSATPDGHDVGVLRSTTLLPPRCCSVPSHPTLVGAERGRARPRMAARPRPELRRRAAATSGQEWSCSRPRRAALRRVGLGDRVLSEVSALRSNPRLPAARPRAALRAPGCPARPRRRRALARGCPARRGAAPAPTCAPPPEHFDGSLDWDRLRRAGGRWHLAGPVPHDRGGGVARRRRLSRWVMGQCRPLPVLLAGLRRVLNPADARRIDRLVRGLARRCQHEPSPRCDEVTLRLRLILGGAPHDARVVLIHAQRHHLAQEELGHAAGTRLDVQPPPGRQKSPSTFARAPPGASRRSRRHFAGRYRLRDTVSPGSASMATRIVGRSPSTLRVRQLRTVDVVLRRRPRHARGAFDVSAGACLTQ